MPKRPTDPPEFTPPDWKGDVGPHLESLRKYAEGVIQAELDWYINRKRGRAQASRTLRVLAVALSILGGLVPLIIAIGGPRPAWTTKMGLDAIRFGQVGYLLLAMAGGLILFDRLFGSSTGWMRYIVAIQAIEKARESFRLDWAILSRKLTMSAPDTPEYTDTVDKIVQRLRSAVLETKEQSEKETQAWIQEFQTNLAQFEKDLKSQMEAGRPGGIDVEVNDGNKADTPVEVLLDGMVADHFAGTAGSIGYVAPGLHRVTAKAKKGSRDYSVSALVNVGAGQIAQVKLSLGL